MPNKTKKSGLNHQDYKAALDTIPDLWDNIPETAEDFRKRTLLWFSSYYITVLSALKSRRDVITRGGE